MNDNGIRRVVRMMNHLFGIDEWKPDAVNEPVDPFDRAATEHAYSEAVAQLQLDTFDLYIKLERRMHEGEDIDIPLRAAIAEYPSMSRGFESLLEENARMHHPD